MSKQEIRTCIIKKLKELPMETRQQYNDDLLTQLVASKDWKQSRTIAVTLSLPPEVNTEQIVQAAWKEGKQVVIPYSGKNRRLSFHFYDSQTEIKKSNFGIWEPVDCHSKVPPGQIDLVLVPGLAYSEEGYRIGFGGGYYDRYLASFQGRTVSLLYPFQLKKAVSLLAESFDIPVQQLLIASE